MRKKSSACQCTAVSPQIVKMIGKRDDKEVKWITFSSREIMKVSMPRKGEKRKNKDNCVSRVEYGERETEKKRFH